MGAFFTSFDDAWSFFLGRTEPLEDFFAEFPDDDEADAVGWLVEPSEDIKAAARPVREALAQFPWLFPVPDHFLHVWIGLRDRIAGAAEKWERLEAFSIDYAKVNCFHAAVVVEVDGPMGQLVGGTSYDDGTYLSAHDARGRPRSRAASGASGRADLDSAHAIRRSSGQRAHLRSVPGGKVDAVSAVVGGEARFVAIAR